MEMKKPGETLETSWGIRVLVPQSEDSKSWIIYIGIKKKKKREA